MLKTTTIAAVVLLSTGCQSVSTVPNTEPSQTSKLFTACTRHGQFMLQGEYNNEKYHFLFACKPLKAYTDKQLKQELKKLEQGEGV